MKKLILYGCGNRCRILLSLLKNTEYTILGIVDSNPANYGRVVEQVTVKTPDMVIYDTDAYVCVTFYSSLVYEPTWDKLVNEYNVDKSKLMSFYDLVIEIYRDKIKIDKIHDALLRHRTIFFDGTWSMGLGGVESWLKDITASFKEINAKNLYLLTPLSESIIPERIRAYTMDFSFDEPGSFTMDNIVKGIDFLEGQLPCTLVFSRIDELMLAAFLLREKYPDYIKIVMTVHGSCDGMCTDVLSFGTMISEYVCVSRGIKAELIRRGAAPECIHTMTVPIDYDKELDRTYALNRKEPLRIGYAGRLEVFEKRLDILLNVVAELEKNNVNYVLDIAGDGSYQDEISRYIENHGLNNKLRLVGNIERSKINEFWKVQDIAVNVSDNEGRPISNMEAMLNGAVPVVTRTVGAMEDVRDGENGYAVSLCDYKSMAEKIKYIDLHRNILQKLGHQAYSDMRQKINPEEYIRMWRKLIYF